MTRQPLFQPSTRREFVRRALLTGAGTAAAVSAVSRGMGASAAAGTPASKEITIAVPIYWGTLDYRKLSDYNDWRVAELTYSALVRNDDQFRPIPDLAQKWEQPDPKTLVFHLRSAKFHDGTAVTSQDVKSTFDSVLDVNFGAPNRPLFASIAAVDAPDPQTVIMHLSAPSPSLMAFLPWVGIVPQHYAAQHPDLVATHPIGCGPYKFVSTIQQSQTVLEAFGDYWGGVPAFETLTFHVIPEDTTRTIEIQSGNVDIATTIAFSDISTIKQDPNLYTIEVAPNGFSYIGLNMQNPILADLRVRQAIAYAIDRDAINAAVYDGLCTKAIGPVIPSSWGYDKDVTVYDYDPVKSKQLLAAAGHSQGLSFKMTSLNTQEFTEIATILTQELGKIGIHLQVTLLEQTVLTQQVLKGVIGDLILGFGWGEQMDPLQHMYRQFLSANQPPHGYNFVHYTNPELDKALIGANTTIDITQRKKYLDQAQQIITANVPYVFLFNEPEFWAVSKHVANVTAPPPMDRQFLDLAMKAKTT